MREASRTLTLRIAGRRTTMRLSRVEQRVLAAICSAEGHSIDAFCTAAVAERAASGLNNTQRVRDAMLEYLGAQWQDAGRRRTLG